MQNGINLNEHQIPYNLDINDLDFNILIFYEFRILFVI